MNAQTSIQTTVVPALLERLRVPQLRFRPATAARDAWLLADIYNRSMAADRIDRAATADSITAMQRALPHCDPARDMLLAEVADAAVGFVRLCWGRERSGTVVFRHMAALVPEWRRRGIGAAMLQQAHAGLRQIAGALGMGRSAYLQAVAADGQTGLLVLLLQEGYAAVRHTALLVRRDLGNIPLQPLPERLEVRELQAHEYRALWDARHEALRDRWGQVQPEDGDFSRWLEGLGDQHGLWQTAWDGEQIAGAALARIDHAENAHFLRRRGLTQEVWVRPRWRRRGLAKALVTRGLRALAAHGMTEAAFEVDVESPHGAPQLFKRLGYQPAWRATIYRRPLHG
jgi:ribosomal protein S18 acetylase RimI-like enzyme